MSTRHGSWWIPAGAFLAAVLLSLGSHSSIRALTMRLAAEPTAAPCSIKSLTFVPVLRTVKVTRIKSVTGPASKPAIVEDTDDQILFDDNTDNPGGGKRIFVGKKDLDDKRHHDIVVVLAEVLNPVKGSIVTFEAMDVDDPSAGDPTGQLKTDVEGRLAILKKRSHVTLLENSISHHLRPSIDWEDFSFDNRGDIVKQAGGPNEGVKREGCDFQSWDGAKLTKEEVDSLKAQNLTKANFEPFREITEKDGHVHDDDVRDIICRRAKVPVNVIENGIGRVAVILKVSRQPGDNYKVLAICDQPAAQYDLQDDNGKKYETVVKKGDEILNKTIPVQDDQPLSRVVMRERRIKGVPPGASRKFNIIYQLHPPEIVKITEMLTVWRRLHMEFDYMDATSSSDNRPGFNAIQDMGTVNEDYPIPHAAADGENTPVITPTIAGLLRNEMYPKAYVEPVNDISRKWNQAPLRRFLRNVGGNLLGPKEFDGAAGVTRDLETPKERGDVFYWVAHIQAMYEHDDQKSNDPDSHEGGNTLGGLASGRDERDILTGAAFHETIRDIFKMGGAFNVEDGNGTLGNKTAKMILEDTYAHEVSHQFDTIKHFHGGIMSVAAVYFAVNPGLSDLNLAMIRSSNRP